MEMDITCDSRKLPIFTYGFTKARIKTFMALFVLDKIYSSRIKAIDERIEETLEEIDRYLKNGNQKDLTKHRKSSFHSLENISTDHNAVKECLQKMLHLCHEQPDSMEAMFSILKKMAQHSLPFQAACDCGICTDCLEDACDNACKKQHPRIGSAKECSSGSQSSEDVKSLWCSICYHIQAYITHRLVGNKEVLSSKQGLFHDTNWESYFEMLRLLFVPGQIQRIHQWVRSEQLRRASCPCKPTFSTCCVSCLIQWCIQSLARDVAMRPSLGMTWHDLSECYISSVRANVMLCLQDLRSHWQRRHEVKDKSHFLPCLLNPNSCWAHRHTEHSQDTESCSADVGLQQSDSYIDWTDHWIVVAAVNLINELHWFEQQLNGISCRTWAVLSESPQQSSADGTTAWDEPCIWDWRQLLTNSGVLTMLQQSIQDLIQIKWPLHQKDSVSVELAGTKLQVTDSAFHAVHYLAVYGPAISACQGVLEPFRASFIHAVHVALGQAIEDLETRFGHTSLLPHNLYIMLNTGCYLENSLLNCASALSGRNDGISSAPFHGLQQRVTAAIKHTEKLIFVHHLKWLASCIAPSSNSALDLERACAWNLYVKALCNDLKCQVGPSQCSCALRQLLTEMLRQARSLQMLSEEPELRLVLHSAYDALFLVCSNTQELLGLPASPVAAGPIAELHRHCNALFTSVSIKDSATAQQRDEQQPDNKHDPQQPHQQAPWLCFVQPSLFPGPPWAQLPTNTRIWLPLALCLASERPHPLLLLQCLTAVEGTLSTLLASEAASQAKSYEVADEEQHLLNALLSILMLCDHHEGELTSVLVSVVEKLDGWREFESTSLGKAKSERAWWFQSLQGLLMPYLQSVVASLATPILTSTREKQCLWLHQMWEEIEQHSKTSSNLQGESLLVELLSCTMAVVPTFPAPLLACLTRLGGLVSKVGVVSASNSAAMQVLLSTLYDILHSSKELDKLFGSRLDSKINLECAHIANEMIAHALQLTQRQEDELLGSHDCDQRVLNCLDLLAGLLTAERDASWEESLSQTAEDITLGLVAEQLMRTPQAQAAPCPQYHCKWLPSRATNVKNVKILSTWHEIVSFIADYQIHQNELFYHYKFVFSIARSFKNFCGPLSF
ncbi:uncharacterized protein LOC142571350 isoform X2 [Dermacentor variabilis]|uniref:uncharacterized protein LOC142571350 isoform X2 n=1 Tax=Dermacentor variabilis TaxID=34621 RepID=UPI003F5AE10E